MKHIKHFMPIFEEHDDYEIHDNGGRPLIIRVNDKRLKVYTNNFTINRFKKVWPGEDGSTILVELEDGRIAFFGTDSYLFEPSDEIEKYDAPIGNSDVPYPVLIGKDNLYFLLDKVYVDKEEFENAIKDVKSTHGDNIYGRYYDVKDKIKSHPLKTTKIQGRIAHGPESAKVLDESTGHYFPSTGSDDGVWDFVFGWKKTLSKDISKFIKKSEKEILGFDTMDWETPEERQSLQHWQLATMITGLLQDGFVIDKSLAEKALKYYDKALELDEDHLKNWDVKTLKNYKSQLQKSRDGLKETLDEEKENTVYKPGFMEDIARRSDSRLSETVHIKKLGTVGTDTASFLIVDPCYIKKEDLEDGKSLMDKMLSMDKGGKSGSYTFSGIKGNGQMITTGGDGGYEVLGVYDGDNNIPKAVVLNISGDKLEAKMFESHSNIINENNFNKLKGIQVNLWDDYKREPEYDQTDTTTLKVEEYEVGKDKHKLLVDYLFSWIQENIEIDGVTFIDGVNDFTHHDRFYHVLIHGLNNEKFDELNKILSDAKLEFEGIPYRFISES